jgi:EAL domain-containing protein (putative c-di-GMP-specific phosphodiesterase class I)
MVTAEGVETRAQLQFLHDIDCDLLQALLAGRGVVGQLWWVWATGLFAPGQRGASPAGPTGAGGAFAKTE